MGLFTRAIIAKSLLLGSLFTNQAYAGDHAHHDHSHHHPSSLELKSGHVRIMPPGQKNTAAFMVLKNNTDKTIRLTSVTSPASKVAEFHTHKKADNGMMQMRQMAEVIIKAKSDYVFKSGGDHIMLMGLTQKLSEDKKVAVTLTADDKKTYEFSLPAMSILKESSEEVKQEDHSHHHHHMHH